MTIALCIGSAETVWSEIDHALSLCKPDVLVSVNRMARDWPYSLDAWVSYHPELLQRWYFERKRNGLPDHKANFIPGHARQFIPNNIGPVHKIAPVGGSSGLGAVEVAISYFGATKVILAGIGLDHQAGHFNQAEVKGPWKDGLGYRKAWLRYPLEKRKLIRSCGGWTREQLGEPTKEWIET